MTQKYDTLEKVSRFPLNENHLSISLPSQVKTKKTYTISSIGLLFHFLRIN